MALTCAPRPAAVTVSSASAPLPCPRVEERALVSADLAAGYHLCAYVVLPSTPGSNCLCAFALFSIMPLDVSWEANSGVGQKKAET